MAWSPGQTDVRVRGACQIKATPKGRALRPFLPSPLSSPPHLSRRVVGRGLPLASAATARTSYVGRSPDQPTSLQTLAPHAHDVRVPFFLGDDVRDPASKNASVAHRQLRRHAPAPPPHPRTARGASAASAYIVPAEAEEDELGADHALRAQGSGGVSGHVRVREPQALHVRPAQAGHRRLQPRPDHRRGRLRRRLQGGRRRGGGRRQAAQPGGHSGRPRVADRGELPRAVQPSEPGGAHRLLLRRRPPAAGVRVHGQGQPREPPLPTRVHPVVDDPGEDRAGRGEGACVPPRRGAADHLPRLQDLQHPARRRLQREAVGLRAGQGGAGGGQDARVHPGDGHLRLRGAGVHGDGAPHGDERRVRLRGGAAGDAGGAAGAGAEPGGQGRQPGGLGAPHPHPAQEAGEGGGRAHGAAGRLLGARAGARGQVGIRLPQPEPQGAPRHEQGRARPRGRARHPAGGGGRRRRWCAPRRRPCRRRRLSDSGPVIDVYRFGNCER